MGTQIFPPPTSPGRLALLVTPVAEMTYQPKRHPPLVLSLGSPPVRQPADIFLLLSPPLFCPSCGSFFNSTIIIFSFAIILYTFISRSSSLLVVLCGVLAGVVSFSLPPVGI